MSAPWPWEDEPCPCRQCVDGPGIDFAQERHDQGWEDFWAWVARRDRSGVAATEPC